MLLIVLLIILEEHSYINLYIIEAIGEVRWHINLQSIMCLQIRVIKHH